MLTNDDHLPVYRHTSTQKTQWHGKRWRNIGIPLRSTATMYPLRFRHKNNKNNDAIDEKWDISAFIPFAKYIFPFIACYSAIKQTMTSAKAEKSHRTHTGILEKMIAIVRWKSPSITICFQLYVHTKKKTNSFGQNADKTNLRSRAIGEYIQHCHQ